MMDLVDLEVLGSGSLCEAAVSGKNVKMDVWICISLRTNEGEYLA